MINKICPYCHNIIQYGNNCKCIDKHNKIRHKEYKKYRTDNKEQVFYNSKDWIRIRDYVRIHYNSIDVYVLYKTGRVECGDIVHHVVEIKDNWDKRLDVNNLIYVSSSTHQYIHCKYSQGKKEKEKMQNELIEAIKWYNGKFGK